MSQLHASAEIPLRRLYAGFDALDIVFKGSLNEEGLATLEIAHTMALDRDDAVLTVLGPDKEPVHVHQRGLPGGYRFRCTTGPVGEIWGFTNTQPQGWNVFCSVRAATLAAYGWHETVRRVRARLEAFGCHPIDHRVARIDYAIDFLMPPAFALDFYQFVAHARTKVKPYWGKREVGETATQPSAVCRGRRLESVTVGKMPGRQICVYDKRREAVEQMKHFWFRLWYIGSSDTANVWRAELRAGKRELRRWPIRTLAEVEASIADVFVSMAEQVRYVDAVQTDINVSRQRLHPLWLAVHQHLEDDLFEFRSGLLPSEIRELEREIAQQRYRTMILGNLAGYAVACGLDDASMERNLPEIARSLTVRALRDPQRRFAQSVARARERLRFVTDDRRA